MRYPLLTLVILAGLFGSASEQQQSLATGPDLREQVRTIGESVRDLRGTFTANDWNTVMACLGKWQEWERGDRESSDACATTAAYELKGRHDVILMCERALHHARILAGDHSKMDASLAEEMREIVESDGTYCASLRSQAPR